MSCFLCDKNTPIEPLRGVTLQYVHFDDHAGFSGDNKPIPMVDTEHFIGMLVSLGYKKPQAKRLVESAIAAGRYTGDENVFVSYLCSQK